jgi:hypothetical protein
VETRIREALRSVSAASVAFLETATDYDRLLQTVVQSISQVLDATCMISLRVEPRSIMPVAMHDADEAVRAVFAPVIGRAFPLAEARLVDGVMQSGTWLSPTASSRRSATRSPTTCGHRYARSTVSRRRCSMTMQVPSTRPASVTSIGSEPERSAWPR